MKYYRDMQPGEMLQAGDEALRDDDEWVSVLPAAYGMPPFRRSRVRRLVDLPVLQPVTPEAMAELEGDEIRTIAVLSQGSAKTMLWNTELQRWCSNAGFDNPLEWDWFIDLATIPGEA